jgi:ribose 5-phosphate isomerase A
MAAAAALTAAEMKKLVGYKAVDDYVRSGMVVGLGTGSTATFAVERLGQLLASGERTDIICIPTSEATRKQAASLNIPLCTLNERSRLDVTIDGADDVDPSLVLIKGGGGALLREKLVEVASTLFVCIVDDTKLSPALGPKFPLPVEITPFCHEHTCRVLAELGHVKRNGGVPRIRMGNVGNNKVDGDSIAITDNGNYIVDITFSAPIADAIGLATEIANTVGVVEHGIFHGDASPKVLIVACSDGTVKVTGQGQGHGQGQGQGQAVWW